MGCHCLQPETKHQEDTPRAAGRHGVSHAGTGNGGSCFLSRCVWKTLGKQEKKKADETGWMRQGCRAGGQWVSGWHAPQEVKSIELTTGTGPSGSG